MPKSDESKKRLEHMDIDALKAMTADLLGGKVVAADDTFLMHALIALGTRTSAREFKAFCEQHDVPSEPKQPRLRRAKKDASAP